MPDPSNTSRVRRFAAGAWHVFAGIGHLLGHPRLWPWAVAPALCAALGLLLGGIAGFFIAPRIDAVVLPGPGRLPSGVEILLTLVVWIGVIAAGLALGLAAALLVSAPFLDVLSRQVESEERYRRGDGGGGLRWELAQSFRAALYFTAVAPFVFVLSFIPFLGPLLGLIWGSYVLAFQLTEPALTRRGLSFAQRRNWHRNFRPESLGFGVASLVTLLVPFANLLLVPAVAISGTRLVVELGVEADTEHNDPIRTIVL